MSIYCVGLCLTSLTGLSLSDKFILLALCEKADNDGTNAWPSVATLARYAECSERTVQRALGRLRESGWIKVTKRATQNQPRIYAVNLARFQSGVNEGCQIVTRGVTGEAARGDRAMAPDPSSTRPLPLREQVQAQEQAQGQDVAGTTIRDFVKWWIDTYGETMNGTAYILRPKRDITLIKRLLSNYGLERLRLMSKLFLVTDDVFISSTDRGIPLLSAKSMWLDKLLRAHGR